MTPAITSGCPGLDALNPLCQAVSAGSSVADAGASAILTAMASWVVSGAAWLLDQLGGVLSGTTTIDVSASWFTTHYQVMMVIAGVAAAPLLVGAMLQAIYRQSTEQLLRAAVVHLPLAFLLSGVAVELVRLSLAATDALCVTVSAGDGAGLGTALSGLATTLAGQVALGDQGVPSFVVLLTGLLVAIGAFLLWIELVVRAAAVYVTVLFLPLALLSLVWPAIAHWCRRLVDTLAALVLSKFVIVAILSLATGAIDSSGGFATVLSGTALLMVAAFAPFTLLRLIPMIEGGAAQQLEGARHRVQQSFGSLPRSAASVALRQARAVPLATAVGTGLSSAFEAPGVDVRPTSRDTGDRPGGAIADRSFGSSPTGGERPFGGGAIPEWQGSPASNAAFEQVMAGGPSPSGGRGPRPVLDEPPGGADRAVTEPSPPFLPTDGVVFSRGHHVLARDSIGPVLRWLPGPDDRHRGAVGDQDVDDGAHRG